MYLSPQRSDWSALESFVEPIHFNFHHFDFYIIKQPFSFPVISMNFFEYCDVNLKV